MDPFAIPSDLESIWRPLSDDEALVVLARLDQASQIVRDEVPLVGGLDVDARIAAGSLSALTARDVVVAMVHRVMLNPAGIRSEGSGPFTVTYDQELSSGEMHLTGRELARLSGRGRSPQRAFTITPGSGPVFA